MLCCWLVHSVTSVVCYGHAAAAALVLLLTQYYAHNVISIKPADIRILHCHVMSADIS